MIQEKVDILSGDRGRHFERESSYEHEEVYRNIENNHARLSGSGKIVFYFFA